MSNKDYSEIERGIEPYSISAIPPDAKPKTIARGSRDLAKFVAKALLN